MDPYIVDDAKRIRCLATGVAPTVQPLEAIWLIYAVLLRAKGTEVSAEDVHDAWAASVVLQGSSSPALIPYADLDPAVQEKDCRYAAAIRALAGGADVTPPPTDAPRRCR